MAKSSKGFIGWVAIAETGTVYLFASDYATKDSVAKNLMRCVDDALQIEGCQMVDMRIYNLDQNEQCIEEAEEWALDHQKLDLSGDYELCKKIIKVTKQSSKKASNKKAESVANEHPETCIFEIAKEYNADSRFVKELFDCYMMVVEGRDYEEEKSGFKEMFDFMRNGQAVA